MIPTTGGTFACRVGLAEQVPLFLTGIHLGLDTGDGAPDHAIAPWTVRHGITVSPKALITFTSGQEESRP